MIVLFTAICLWGLFGAVTLARRSGEGERAAAWWCFVGFFGMMIIGGFLTPVLSSLTSPTSLGYFLVRIPFVLAQIIGLVGIVQLGRRIDWRRALGPTIDALIATASVGIAIWYGMAATAWHESSILFWPRVGVVIPALTHLGYLFLAVVLLSSGAMDARRTVLALCAGLAGLTACISDVAKASAVVSGDSFTVFGMVGWGVSLVALAFGLRWQLREHAGAAILDEPSGRLLTRFVAFARRYWHYAAVLVALFEIAIFEHRLNGTFEVTAYGEASFLLLLLLARQIVVVRDNARLAEKVDSANGALRSLVQHLKSLNELTSAINVQLEARTVLETAAAHIRIVLGTDAVLVTRETDGRVEVVAYGEDAQELEGLVRQGKNQRSLPIQLTEMAENGRQSFAAVCPILWDGALAGRIVAVRRDRSFEYSEIHLLANIAGEIGKALLNATRHERALDAADRDPVTGLLNHRAFHQRLQAELEIARSSDASLSLAMIDMNNFKLFNDTYGHLAGDAVLRQVAEALLIECPVQALLARYGGDEYAIAAPGYDEHQLVDLAERIRDRLLQTGYIDPGGTRVPIALAFGIACFPTDASYRHDLINIADQNLYEAKHSEGGIRGASASERENRELRVHASFETLDALVSAVDNKDRYTRKHSEDVTEYALWIAEEIGFSEEAKRTVRRAGLLHDVGKIGVPDGILRKPGRLTPEEFEIVQRHPRLGELIVSAIPGMEDIVDGVRSHHERYDGAGYPDGLLGDDIPLMGRILAVADAFSAMTTDRPYRRGMDWPESLSRIEAGIGTQFDPKMATHFLTALRRRYPELGTERKAA